MGWPKYLLQKLGSRKRSVVQMQIRLDFQLQPKESPKQNQNLPGFCHYCKRPGDWKKGCYKLNTLRVFSTLNQPSPQWQGSQEPQGLVPIIPLNRLGETPSPDWECIFEPFFPILGGAGAQPHCQLTAPPRGIQQFRQGGLNNSVPYPFLSVWTFWETPILFFLVPVLLFICWAKIS